MPARSHFVILAAGFTLLAAVPAAESAVTFNFNYTDGSGVGFNNGTLGATRRAALEDVANNTIGQLLNYNSTVDIDVSSGNFGSNNFLAAAGTLFFQGQGRNARGLVQQHIVNGTDPSGGVADGQAQFNFSTNYYYGANASGIGGNQYDFRSVALHELTHALGFVGLLNSSGNAPSQSGVSGTFSSFDEMLVTANGTKLLDLSPSAYQAAIQSDAIFLNGANSMAANGGTRPGIYAPNPFADGSSLSHFDSTVPVMYYAIPPATIKRSYTALDRAALLDLGYSFAAVPEPGTLALLGAGGLTLLRRRRA